MIATHHDCAQQRADLPLKGDHRKWWASAGGYEAAEQHGVRRGLQHPGGHGHHLTGQRQGGEAEEGGPQGAQGRRGPGAAGRAPAAKFAIFGVG